MPYKLTYIKVNVVYEIGGFDTFTEAYSQLNYRFPQIKLESPDNSWHLMMYDYAKAQVHASKEPVKVAYEEPALDNSHSVYICHEI